MFRFFLVLSLLAQFRLPYGTGIEVADTTAEPFLSRKIDGLLDLTKRQGRTCSVPGGPICDAIHCCAVGQKCCPSGCCPSTAACFQTNRCCPLTATICSGQTACCPAGYTCCGSTCCDSSTEFCERGHCFDTALNSSVARFELTPKNKELLENMCKGMERGNGKRVNSEKLTYRGREKDGYPRGPVRTAAGCVQGYCANIIRNGGNPAFDSCDEYPPASSLEGGATRLAGNRIITCIPLTQNRQQGWRFMRMLAQFEKAHGRKMMRGEEFVISIDCDSVLPPTVPELRKRASIGDSGFGVVDLDLPMTANATDLFVFADLGDLAAGTYDVTIQSTHGSTTGGFVFDCEGDDTFASLDSGLTAGQSQQYSFAFNDAMFGVSIALSTRQNDTNVTWSLGGSTSTPGTLSATSTPLSSGLASTATAGSGISSARNMFSHCQGISGWVVLVTTTVLGISFTL